jgi:dihydroorotate dehydrogenase
MSAPLLLKIAPDLGDPELAGIADAALAASIDGFIVSNTTISRDGLVPARRSGEAGGLSGRPLFRRSTIMLAKLRQLVGKRAVLVGVGGIDSPETAFAKIAAGADLVQLYTGMIYEGPDLPARILAGLVAELDRRRLAAIVDAVGIDAGLWSKEGPEA